MRNPKMKNPRIKDPRIENPMIEDPRIKDPRTKHPWVKYLRIKHPRIKHPRIKDPVHGLKFCCLVYSYSIHVFCFEFVQMSFVLWIFQTHKSWVHSVYSRKSADCQN